MTRSRRILVVTLGLLAVVLVVVAGLLVQRPSWRAAAGSWLGDAWVTTKVKTQLVYDEDVPARAVSVTTRDRIVTLSGALPDRRAREQAVAIAGATDGVEAVRDRLWLQDEPPAATSGPQLVERPTPRAAADAIPPALLATLRDDWIQTQVRAQYFSEPGIKTHRVDVYVDDRVVRLEGVLPGEPDRERAIAIARSVQGVKEVEASGLRVMLPGGEGGR